MNWDSDSQDAFDELGWSPEGKVFYSYHANTTKNCSCTLCFYRSGNGRAVRGHGQQ